jgi:hypothetical protein
VREPMHGNSHTYPLLLELESPTPHTAVNPLGWRPSHAAKVNHVTLDPMIGGCVRDVAFATRLQPRARVSPPAHEIKNVPDNEGPKQSFEWAVNRWIGERVGGGKVDGGVYRWVGLDVVEHSGIRNQVREWANWHLHSKLYACACATRVYACKTVSGMCAEWTCGAGQSSSIAGYLSRSAETVGGVPRVIRSADDTEPYTRPRYSRTCSRAMTTTSPRLHLGRVGPQILQQPRHCGTAMRSWWVIGECVLWVMRSW